MILKPQKIQRCAWYKTGSAQKITEGTMVSRVHKPRDSNVSFATAKFRAPHRHVRVAAKVVANDLDLHALVGGNPRAEAAPAGVTVRQVRLPVVLRGGGAPCTRASKHTTNAWCLYGALTVMQTRKRVHTHKPENTCKRKSHENTEGRIRRHVHRRE